MIGQSISLTILYLIIKRESGGVIVCAGKADQVKFYYYSQSDTFQEVNKDNIRALNMNKDVPLYIVIDGFLSHFEASMSQTVKNGLFRSRPTSNVLIVDWSRLSGFDALELHENTKLTELMMVYNIAKSKVGLVGEKVAMLLESLVRQNMTDFSRTMVIGYSLGAHIAGVAGWKIIDKYYGRITRITGLDPAGGFPMSNPHKRLDKSDAEFVDVYHSNRYTAGDMEHHVGHVDVYLNGGKVQPGCTSPSIINSTICNHAFSWRAWDYCITEKCIACRCHTLECKKCNVTCSNGILVGNGISLDVTGDYCLKLGPIPSWE